MCSKFYRNPSEEGRDPEERNSDIPDDGCSMLDRPVLVQPIPVAVRDRHAARGRGGGGISDKDFSNGFSFHAFLF